MKPIVNLKYLLNVFILYFLNTNMRLESHSWYPHYWVFVYHPLFFLSINSAQTDILINACT